MSDAPKIKVCGMADAENLAQLARLKPDYVGFIFYPNLFCVKMIVIGGVCCTCVKSEKFITKTI